MISEALNYDTVFETLSNQAKDFLLFLELLSNSKKNTPPIDGVFCCNSLTMTYFHTGIRTIIGADSFHCPVRDGKEWYQVAMVVRHNLLSPRRGLGNQFIELISLSFRH